MPPRWTRKPGGRRVRVRNGNSGIPAPPMFNQSLVALFVFNTVSSSRENYDDEDDDDDDDDSATRMCYTLSSCRSGRLVGKQLFRP